MRIQTNDLDILIILPPRVFVKLLAYIVRKMCPSRSRAKWSRTVLGNQ